MKNPCLLLMLIFLGLSAGVTFGQTPSTLKRTTYKTDKLDFGSGGTLAVIGSPIGSVSIEGWSRNEIEVSATIEVNAHNEADLAKLSAVTGFVLEESLGRTGVITVGTHDKKIAKQLGQKLAKSLAGMPFRVDYVIKVPKYCDLQIDGGKGDVTISGVEGMHRINYLESEASFALVGGSIIATVGKGNVLVTVPARGWRGRLAEVQLASGKMDVRLPAGLNAELDATILRTGAIENTFDGLKPRSRKGEFTDKSVIAKAGTGGIPLKFTVGDGTLKLSRFEGSN